MILIVLMAAVLAAPALTLEGEPAAVARAFERKAVVGAAAFAAEVDGVVGGLRARAEATGQCPSSGEAAAAAELEFVRRTRDPQAWTRSRGEAEVALAERRRLRALYLGGAVAPAPYGLVSRMAARAKAESDPRLAELYRRMAEDQFARIDSLTLRPFLGQGVHTTWEQGLDEAALAYVAASVEGERCAIEVANAAWLKADLRDHGWYRISTHGAAADRAAWSIVQHARHDLALREAVLDLLEPLWRSGETRGENFASLYDDTAAARGRPARFGLIGACTAPGVWTPGPMEDGARTDGWRAKAGLPPLVEEVAVRSRGCAN